jgi:hypothetical protein
VANDRERRLFSVDSDASMKRSLLRQNAASRSTEAGINPLNDGRQHRDACRSGIATRRESHSHQDAAAADFRTIVAEFC